MFVPARWALGVPLGLLGFVGSMTLEGGHPTVLLQGTALLTVLGTMCGGMLALRGPTAAVALLRTAWLGAPADPEVRAERLRDVILLEQLSLLGACLGLLMGSLQAIAQFLTPEEIGPAIAMAIVSVVVALLGNVFFLMPMKHALLPIEAPEEHLPMRAATARALRLFGTAALFVTGASFVFVSLIQVPVLLMLVSALVPSLLSAPAAILAGPVSRIRCRWIADTMWSAGTLAAGTGIMHVFSVLDHPRLLPPGVAVAFVGFVVPGVFATLAYLRGTLAPAKANAPDTERSPYLAFAALALAGFAGLALLAALAVSRMPRPHG